MEIRIDIPPEYEWLFESARYKVAHGGRWSWKSTSVARYIVFRCMERPIRVLCARETMKSIRESVHHLIVNQITKFNLSKYFIINKADITCQNGSYIFFEGLLRNVHNIKSLEDVDICWVEEAQNVSEQSWTDLSPTIRKSKSEILITFNRQYTDDATDKRYVQNPPENSIVREINYNDVYGEDEIPDILKTEIADCLRRDPTRVTYDHIFLNKPVGVGAKIWAPFKQSDHVITPDHWLYNKITMEEIAKIGDCFMAMDPHSKYYPFCLWGALVPKNARLDDFYLVIYNEWPTIETLGDYYSELRKKVYFDGSIKELSRQIYLNDGTAEHGIKVLKRFMDTRFAKGAGGENWSTSTTGIVHEFAKPENGGLVFNLPAEVTIDRQRNILIDKMQCNTILEINEFNSPDLYVLPHCRNVIQSLENHRCIEGTEKEDEKYKDPSDALRILSAGIEGHRYTKTRVNMGYQPVMRAGAFG